MKIEVGGEFLLLLLFFWWVGMPVLPHRVIHRGVGGVRASYLISDFSTGRREFTCLRGSGLGVNEGCDGVQ